MNDNIVLVAVGVAVYLVYAANKKAGQASQVNTSNYSNEGYSPSSASGYGYDQVPGLIYV